MNPKVSIVIPVFNKENWIKETLVSVVNQTYRNWETIIVDDGSTDASLSVIENFIQDHAGNWKVISQRNQGQCMARNAGIAASSGEFIAFLDGDDCWADNKLDVQVALLMKHPRAALAICPYLIYEDINQKFKNRLVMHRKTKTMLRQWLNLRGFGGGTESTGLVRKDSLLKTGGFDPNLSTSAGLDLTIRLSQVGDILFANNTFMKYRIHTGQWHANLEILSNDLDSLRRKKTYEGLLKPSTLQRQHEAYLLFQELRQGTSLRSSTHSKGGVKTYFHLIALICHIFERNLIARLRAIFPNLLTDIPRARLGAPFS